VSLRIVQPGLLTTVQDLGRHGHQIEGVPVGGAMDTVALRVANWLVGNNDDAAALEITIVGPSIVFQSDALVALGGAELAACLDDRPLPSWHVARVSSGSTLTFLGSPSGCHAYLAVSGGIDVPIILGSRGTYLRGGFGGHEGRALRAADVLPFGATPPQSMSVAASLGDRGERSAVARWSVGMSVRRAAPTDAPVRVVDGTHTRLLTDESRQRLFGAEQEFRVSTQSDRMGYRLTGASLELKEPTELMSEGVTFGTIQLPPGGNPIVLMADRQTTGGYPRIGEVASVDLPVLAQRRPGDRARFTSISVAEAQQAYIERENELAAVRRAISLRLGSP
jgi:antagonist of KipI